MTGTKSILLGIAVLHVFKMLIIQCYFTYFTEWISGHHMTVSLVCLSWQEAFTFWREKKPFYNYICQLRPLTTHLRTNQVFRFEETQYSLEFIILSSFTYPHVVPNLYDFLFFCGTQFCSFSYNEIWFIRTRSFKLQKDKRVTLKSSIQLVGV